MWFRKDLECEIWVWNRFSLLLFFSLSRSLFSLIFSFLWKTEILVYCYQKLSFSICSLFKTWFFFWLNFCVWNIFFFLSLSFSSFLFKIKILFIIFQSMFSFEFFSISNLSFFNFFLSWSLSWSLLFSFNSLSFLFLFFLSFALFSSLCLFLNYLKRKNFSQSTPLFPSTSI